MISKTDSSIDIVKKVTYVYMYLIGSKAVLYCLLSSSFLFNVVIIRHFNTVNTYLVPRPRRAWGRG